MTTVYVDDKDKLPERHKNDLYVTERNLIRAAYDAFVHTAVNRCLDIGAGDGRWGKVLHETQPMAHLTGVELEDQPDPGFDSWYGKTDFLEWGEKSTNQMTDGFDLIVSNPPYFIAEPIIRVAWELLVPGGQMIMLLRLAFQASIGRYENLWNDIWPEEVAVCSRRPSFYGGGTNGTDYGLFFWEKDDWGNPVGAPRMWITSLINYDRGDE